jgi:hypothetical protein
MFHTPSHSFFESTINMNGTGSISPTSTLGFNLGWNVHVIRYRDVDSTVLYSVGSVSTQTTSFSTPSTFVFSSPNFFIGKTDMASTADFKGSIAEFSIYNSALTDIQITQLTNQLGTRYGLPVP